MKMTFRWYGEDSDSITLKQIKQIPGMSGVMGGLHYKQAGEVWSLDECEKYVDQIKKAGLACEVIESVNVHEDIKMGLSTRDLYIDNYIETIKNLAKVGVKVVIYNFMPVFDWLRTNLAYEIKEDGSNSLFFDEAALGSMTPLEIVEETANHSNGFTLPGWEYKRLALLEKTLETYKTISVERMLANFQYFLEKVIPVCEEVGVKMACHPDDPAWPIFGLPRMAYNQECYDRIIQLVDSPCNTVCLCTGSLGSERNNDIPAIIRHFGSMNRIGAMHVRNIKFLGHRKFREASHLSESGDIDMFKVMEAIYDTCRDTYIRPDHGRCIWDEVSRPGYGLYDRALGATYLNGLWEAICKMKENN